ncbi:MAG: DUF2461 domain-containing protein [Spirosomaceae bacterium]|jgi:uncharacterized protein (TIGR02453 family)|nr:DUF2461 domain-containing protein [Spirosomataceae bacterium]
MQLDQSTLDFLSDLKENNNKEWFHANRKRYETEKERFEKFCQSVLDGLSKFQDNLINTRVKDCIFRINKDIRFSKDKSPYKLNLAAAFGPGGRQSGRIDYYLHIQPNGESFIGGGIWQPTPAQLSKFRQEIDYNPTELKNIIYESNFRDYYKEIWGERVKGAPKGYKIEHPEIELLRYKQLFFMHRYTDSEVISPDFATEFIGACKLLKPYLDYCNYIFFDETDEKFDL